MYHCTLQLLQATLTVAPTDTAICTATRNHAAHALTTILRGSAMTCGVCLICVSEPEPDAPDQTASSAAGLRLPQCRAPRGKARSRAPAANCQAKPRLFARAVIKLDDTGSAPGLISGPLSCAAKPVDGSTVDVAPALAALLPRRKSLAQRSKHSARRATIIASISRRVVPGASPRAVLGDAGAHSLAAGALAHITPHYRHPRDRPPCR